MVLDVKELKDGLLDQRLLNDKRFEDDGLSDMVLDIAVLDELSECWEKASELEDLGEPNNVILSVHERVVSTLSSR